jgi:tRNA(Ile2) C34 agmatinyltransferase TiaS
MLCGKIVFLSSVYRFSHYYCTFYFMNFLTAKIYTSLTLVNYNRLITLNMSIVFNKEKTSVVATVLGVITPKIPTLLDIKVRMI